MLILFQHNVNVTRLLNNHIHAVVDLLSLPALMTRKGTYNINYYLYINHKREEKKDYIPISEYFNITTKTNVKSIYVLIIIYYNGKVSSMQSFQDLL